MAFAATGAAVAAFVLFVVPQIPEAQRMLDFALRGAFITADTPAQHDFILSMAAEIAPVTTTLGYPQLSSARADKDGKIAYLEFVPSRGKDSHSGPSAKVSLYPLEGKNDKELDNFVETAFKFSATGEGREAEKLLKFEQLKAGDGTAAAYAEKLVEGKDVHYAGIFRHGTRLVSISLRPGPDPEDVPGKDKLRKLIVEGKKTE